MNDTTETYDLLICVDCMMLLANGEPNPEWSEAETEDHLRAMEEVYPFEQWVVVPGDAEKDHEFSWSSCDLCSSPLGGTRMHAVAWEK